MNVADIARTHVGDVLGPHRALMPCVLCQPEGRKDQRALSVQTAPSGRLLAFCFKCRAEFKDLADALGIEPDRRASHEEITEEIQRDRAAKKEKARELFKQTQRIEGTPGETYLRNRGIILPMNPHQVRWHPRCWHPSRTVFGAIIAKISDPQGAGCAIHRTYVFPNGQPIDRNPRKAILGTFSGGAVRLGQGKRLLLGEGIETCLSASQIYRIPAHAALSTAGMKAWVPPELRVRVDLLQDNDASGAGKRACEETAKRLQALGLTVNIFTPEPEFGDFNDQLMDMRRDKAG